jgi:uncharacterized protein (DUF1697 family)
MIEKFRMCAWSAIDRQSLEWVPMPTHVALLRGINVGGRGRVAMADLRELVASLGYEDVATYVQSGNVVFTGESIDAAALEAAIEERLGVSSAVVVLSREELERVVADNPWPDEKDGKHLHAIFTAGEPDADVVSAAQEKASGGDEARIVNGTLYMHTPNGLGRSKLAAGLSRKGPEDGTARNWTTVTKLLAMLKDEGGS